MGTMSAQGTLPVSGASIAAEPITNTFTHIMSTYNGGNITTANVDLTAIASLATAQAVSGVKTYSGLNVYTANQKFNDNVSLTLGTGSDATILFDTANTVVATAAQLVLTPTTDTIFSNGTGVVVGHTAQMTVGAVVPEMQILGTSSADTRLVLGRFSADGGSGIIQFAKSRDPAIFDGSFAIVEDNDVAGSISAYVDDGTDFNQGIASMDFVVDDASPAENATGGSIEFHTMDVSGTGALRMAINSAGNVVVGNGSGLVVGHASQATVGAVVPEMQVLGTAAADTRLLMGRFSADASSSTIQFVKSRDPAIFDGSFAIVNDNDEVGSIAAYVDDGADLTRSIASIDFVVDDASPAENAVGGSILFYTTNASGSGSKAVEIDKDGAITAPLNPAFLVTGPAAPDNLTGDGTEHTVNFNSTVFDPGSDQATTTFTAPVTGIYSFNLVWNVGGPGTTTSHTSSIIKIVTSNRTHIVERINIGAVMVSTIHIGSASILTDMDATDTATITVTVTGAAANVDLNQITWSGKLEG